jgi:hypothetical protein
MPSRRPMWYSRKTKVNLSEISNQNNALQVEVVANLNFNTKMMPSKTQIFPTIEKEILSFHPEILHRT